MLQVDGPAATELGRASPQPLENDEISQTALALLSTSAVMIGSTAFGEAVADSRKFCAGAPNAWRTHLGGEEYPTHARIFAENGQIDKSFDRYLEFFGFNPKAQYQSGVVQQTPRPRTDGGWDNSCSASPSVSLELGLRRLYHCGNNNQNLSQRLPGVTETPNGARPMKMSDYVFASESVSEGHPDKVCDRVSDAILDALLTQEPTARVGCETFATTNRVIVGGEVGLSDKDRLDDFMGKVDQIVRDCVRDIGYEQDKFHWNTIEVQNYLHAQSAHISQGVDRDGAGDQGIMFGYAVRETPELMPAPIQYAHAILRRLADARKSGGEPTLGPDAKSQLSVRYADGKPVEVTSIVLSTQHSSETQSSDDIRAIVEPYIREVLPEGWITPKTEWHVNPTGIFVIGGPDGDAGLTGRKIIVDTYGGAAPHGGGAFSGKDPSKVDRSAAYAARYLAKNVVAAGLADRCAIQISYAIGVAKPLSIYVDTYGTGQVDSAEIERALNQVMDLTPRGIRTHLKLDRPIYARTSAYGHFGRTPEADGGFSWEQTDLIDAIKKAL